MVRISDMNDFNQKNSRGNLNLHIGGQRCCCGEEHSLLFFYVSAPPGIDRPGNAELPAAEEASIKEGVQAPE